jgi:hypothetical protein
MAYLKLMEYFMEKRRFCAARRIVLKCSAVDPDPVWDCRRAVRSCVGISPKNRRHAITALMGETSWHWTNPDLTALVEPIKHLNTVSRLVDVRYRYLRLSSALADLIELL